MTTGATRRRLAAVRRRLDPDFEQRILDALRFTHDSIAADYWGDRTPSKTEFAAALIDQVKFVIERGEYKDANRIIHRQPKASVADINRFHALSYATRRRLCWRSGPAWKLLRTP